MLLPKFVANWYSFKIVLVNFFGNSFGGTVIVLVFGGTVIGFDKIEWKFEFGFFIFVSKCVLSSGCRSFVIESQLESFRFSFSQVIASESLLFELYTFQISICFGLKLLFRA